MRGIKVPENHQEIDERGVHGGPSPTMENILKQVWWIQSSNTNTCRFTLTQFTKPTEKLDVDEIGSIKTWCNKWNITVKSGFETSHFRFKLGKNHVCLQTHMFKRPAQFCLNTSSIASASFFFFFVLSLLSFFLSTFTALWNKPFWRKLQEKWKIACIKEISLVKSVVVNTSQHNHTPSYYKDLQFELQRNIFLTSQKIKVLHLSFFRLNLY